MQSEFHECIALWFYGQQLSNQINITIYNFSARFCAQNVSQINGFLPKNAGITGTTHKSVLLRILISRRDSFAKEITS